MNIENSIAQTGGVVAIPVMAAYAACVLARRDSRSDDATALLAAMASVPLTRQAAELQSLALTGMPESLIPFVRDELDVNAICASLQARNASEVCLFSDLAKVTVGYFSIRFGGVQYIDRLPLKKPLDPAAIEVLERTRVDALLKELFAIDSGPVSVSVPAGDQALLEVTSSSIASCVLESDHPQLDVWLLRADEAEASGARRRRVCRTKARQHKRGRLALNLAAEHAMELHAAAGAGQWLMLEAPELRILAPLPDFGLDGVSTQGWLQPTALFDRALGSDGAATVSIDAGLAERLMRHHRWFALVDALSWFKAQHSFSLDRPQGSSQTL